MFRLGFRAGYDVFRMYARTNFDQSDQSFENHSGIDLGTRLLSGSIDNRYIHR